jgi:TonB family protein
MRNAARERDDSILPFSLIFSFLVHGVILLVVLPQVAAAPPLEVTQVFFEDAEDLNFTTHQNVAGSNRTAPSYALPVRGASAPPSNPNVAEAQPSATAQNAGSNQAQTSPYRPSTEVPDGPDPVVQQWERENVAVSGTPHLQEQRGDQSNLRRGEAGRTSQHSTEMPRDPTRVGIPIGPPLVSPPRGGTSEHAPALTPPFVGTENLPRESPGDAGEGDPDALRPSGRDLGPRRIVAQFLPEYPEWALRDRVSATPRFHVRVGPNGNVLRSLLASSSGYSELDRLAQQAVERWLYEPRPGLTEERLAVVEFRIRR